MKKRIIGLGVMLVLALGTLGFTPQPSIVTQTPAHTDSAGTVADYSLTDVKVDTTQDWTFIQPTLKIFTDSLVLNALWCNYAKWESLGTVPETLFVACPLVTDDSDSVNTVVFCTQQIMWKTVGWGTAEWRNWVGPVSLVRPSDAWNPSPGTGGFMAFRYQWNWYYAGFWWVVVRFETRP